MIPQVGQHVKCFLRNATVLEGTVENWTEQQVVLKSLDGETLLILHAPQQDIMITKILPSEEIPKKSEEVPSETQQVICQLPDTGEEDPMALRAKTIAQLKIELGKQDRKIVAGKLKDHHPNAASAPRKVKYGYPQFFKKPWTQ